MPKKKNFLGGMQNYNPKTGEYESRLTKADGEPATKENMPGGEDNNKSFKSFKKDKGIDLDSRIERVIKERVKRGWDSEGTFDVQAVKDTGYYGFDNIDELEKHTFGKKEIKKPTDYEGVEETKYGYVYNVNGESITDLKEERKKTGMPVVEGKEYGYSYTKGGDEVIVDTFEEAYNAVKGKDDTFEKNNNARMDIKNKENSSNKYNLKPSKEIRSIKMGSLSQEIGSTYNHLSDFYGVDLDELVYGEDGFMKTQYPYNFPDFRGDVVYSPKYWDEFEKWAKEEKGVDFTDRAWERYKLDPNYFEYNNSRNFVKEIREYGKKVEPNHPILKKERVNYDDLPF